MIGLRFDGMPAAMFRTRSSNHAPMLMVGGTCRPLASYGGEDEAVAHAGGDGQVRSQAASCPAGRFRTRRRRSVRATGDPAPADCRRDRSWRAASIATRTPRMFSHASA